MPSLVIVGGGYLGCALTHAWPDPVRVVTRSGDPRHPVPSTTEVVAADICQSPDAELRRAVGDAHALVIAVAPGPSQDRTAVYVEGTARVLDAAASSSVRRVVVVGSTSAAADRDGWVYEDDRGAPSGERGAVQRATEARVFAHRTLSTMVLRLGGLYGPGRELSRIYRKRTEGPLPGDGWVPTNLVHRDDAVAALRAAACVDVEGIVHVVDDVHPTRRQMYARIARAREAEPLAWERDPPAGPPHGKRVGNLRLKQWLRIVLRHPDRVLS